MWRGKSTVFRCLKEDAPDCNITDSIVAPSFFSLSFIYFNSRCSEFIFFSINQAGLNFCDTLDSLYSGSDFLGLDFAGFLGFLEGLSK